MPYDAEYQRTYYERNKEQRKAAQKRYREANRDKIRATINEWHNRRTPEQKLLAGVKGRADNTNIAFDLTLEDITIPTHCPILGIELITGQNKQADNSPSLDRIDCSKGYIKGNVQVMSMRANRIKNDGSALEHLAIAHWMLAQSPSQSH